MTFDPHLLTNEIKTLAAKYKWGFIKYFSQPHLCILNTVLCYIRGIMAWEEEWEPE